MTAALALLVLAPTPTPTPTPTTAAPGAGADAQVRAPAAGADAQVRAPAAGADARLRAAEADAAKTKRDVLLVFGSSHCRPCVAMRTWLDDVAPVLARDFVLLTVDESDAGAGDVYERFAPLAGVPYLVVVDANGAKRGDWGGCPDAQADARDFVDVLAARAPHLTDANRRRLVESLTRHATAAFLE